MRSILKEQRLEISTLKKNKEMPFDITPITSYIQEFGQLENE